MDRTGPWCILLLIVFSSCSECDRRAMRRLLLSYRKSVCVFVLDVKKKQLLASTTTLLCCFFSKKRERKKKPAYYFCGTYLYVQRLYVRQCSVTMLSSTLKKWKSIPPGKGELPSFEHKRPQKKRKTNVPK